MPKLSMSVISFRLPPGTVPECPGGRNYRAAAVRIRDVYLGGDEPAFQEVTVDNFRLCLMGWKVMTSRLAHSGTPPFHQWHNYPLVPHHWGASFARVEILRVGQARLSETTQSVVDREGYGWLGLTPEMFVEGYRRFADLSPDADPKLWRYEFRVLPAPPLPTHRQSTLSFDAGQAQLEVECMVCEYCGREMVSCVDCTTPDCIAVKQHTCPECTALMLGKKHVPCLPPEEGSQ